jgi:hypothetical protein
MAIAKQSKMDFIKDTGASDAADWAIARSLSRLNDSADSHGEDVDKMETLKEDSQEGEQSM